ncbi:P-loop containing nucleoside triphosphate hydrolase protein [Entophlyctis helioformis]|nr:P-loop containing nucleoside triphosphate hydrolase protein [Entophlyctis helioformis]
MPGASPGWDKPKPAADTAAAAPAPAAAPAAATSDKPAGEIKASTDPVAAVTEQVKALTTADESAQPKADKPAAKEGGDDEDEDAAPVAPKHAGLIPDNPEREVEVTLADGISAEAMALYQSVSSFEDLGLSENLLKGLYGMGYQRPSKIQARALPLLLANPPKNMIGQSQAGTGKTAAFVLAMLTRVDVNLAATQAICLAPARELARQILDNAKVMGKYTAVQITQAIKDSSARGEKLNAQIIIGTPGTVADLIRRRQIDTKHVRIFVLDEADNMLDGQNLGDQSVRIKNQMPKDCQFVFFSATFPESVRAFATRIAPNANQITLKQEELSVDTIKQFYMDCKNEQHKAEVLCAIYGLLTIGQSIIFVRRRVDADMLANKMTAEGHAVSALHGQHDANDRDKAMDDFREGRSKVLITTNVLARGIDILQVNLVINYDIPTDQSGRPDSETYLHRIGRTGRFGRQGVSINFVHNQASYQEMKTIENFLGREIVRVPTDDYMVIEQMLKKAVKS